MKNFIDWVLIEKKVVLTTCKNKVVEIPKNKDEKEYLKKLFIKGSKK
jgi:hypothetical protein